MPHTPNKTATTETQIMPYDTGPYNKLDNYNLVQNSQVSKGGGVAFYIKNNIHLTVPDKLSMMNEKIFETLL